MKKYLVPMQCSTCVYYQRGECCKDGGKYEGETMRPDEFCKEWKEEDGQPERR